MRSLEGRGAEEEQRDEASSRLGAATAGNECWLDSAASDGGSSPLRQAPSCQHVPFSAPGCLQSACRSGSRTSADSQADREAAAAIFAQLARSNHLQQQLLRPFGTFGNTAVMAMPIHVVAPASLPALPDWDSPLMAQGSGSHTLRSNMHAASTDAGEMANPGVHGRATAAAHAEQEHGGRGASKTGALAEGQPELERRAESPLWSDQSDGMLPCLQRCSWNMALPSRKGIAAQGTYMGAVQSG